MIDTLFGAWSEVSVSAETAALYLLLAFVLSQLVGWVYMWTHTGVSYARTHVQSLVLLSLIVTMIMLVIGDSMARAFGLFGALALIRFRTPIKDTRDTVFLFLSVAIGIAIGSQRPVLAVLCTVFTLGVAAYLHVTRFGRLHRGGGVLRFRMPTDAERESVLHRVLDHYCRSFSLLRVTESDESDVLDYAYQLELRYPELSASLIEGVSGIPGTAEVTLALHDDDEEP